MAAAYVQFLNNTLKADISRPVYELQEHLRSIGVLTNPNLIMLDNSRTLQIELYADNETEQRILDLADKNKDTLGMVSMVCNQIRCMDYRDVMNFEEKIDNGEITDIKAAYKLTEKLREQRRKKNNKKSHER